MEGIVTAGLFQEGYVIESSQQIRNNEKKNHCRNSTEQTPVKLLSPLSKTCFSEKYKKHIGCQFAAIFPYRNIF